MTNYELAMNISQEIINHNLIDSTDGPELTNLIEQELNCYHLHIDTDMENGNLD